MSALLAELIGVSGEPERVAAILEDATPLLTEPFTGVAAHDSVYGNGPIEERIAAYKDAVDGRIRKCEGLGQNDAAGALRAMRAHVLATLEDEGGGLDDALRLRGGALVRGSRRRVVTSLAATSATLLGAPARPAAAAQGAAEMDAEFYLRSLLGQPPSAAPRAPSPPPVSRKLDAAVARRVLDAVTTASAPSLSTSVASLRELTAERRPKLAIEYDRVLTSGAFGGSGGGYAATGGPSSAKGDPTSDQFGFDLSLLALFTLINDERLPRSDRRAFYDSLGSALLAALGGGREGGARGGDEPVRLGNGIGEVIAGTRSVLDSLLAFGYMASYTLDDSDADEKLWREKTSLSATRFTVTLNDSASLRSAVLLNGGRISPELAEPLISTYLERGGVTVVDSDGYFVDGTYRQDPQDYRPTQQVLSFTIAPAGA